MPSWTLDPVDESYFDTARHRFVYEVPVHAAPDDVWAEIASPNPLSWVRTLEPNYLTPQPFGVGTAREVSVLKGVLTLKEHFFRWDNDKRQHSFHATQSNVPLFQSFAEDYRVEEANHGCTFTWTFAFDARRGFGPVVLAGLPVNKLLFKSMVSDTQKYFDAKYPKK